MMMRVVDCWSDEAATNNLQFIKQHLATAEESHRAGVCNIGCVLHVVTSNKHQTVSFD